MSPYVPTEFDHSVNVTKVNHLAEGVRLLLGTAFLIVALYALVAAAIEFALPRISVEWENRLWANLNLSSGVGQGGDAKMAKKQAYLEKLLVKIPEKSRPQGYNFKIHLANSKEINAYAIPGGHIVVTSALFDQIKSENTLIFLIGHEIGHFAHRDHLRGIGMSMAGAIVSMTLTGQAGGGAGAGDALNGLSRLAGLAYSRHDESTADLYGLKILQNVYGHAGGATDLFEMFKVQQNRSGAPPLSIFSTHPLDQDRIDRLKDEMSSNAYPQKETVPLQSFGE